MTAPLRLDDPDAHLDLAPAPAAWSFDAGAQVARARAWGRCELRLPGCGGTDTQTHHRQPRGMGGVARDGTAVNRPSALLRTCLPCHDFAESRREWARRRGLLVPAVARGTAGQADPARVPARLHTVNGAGWWLLDDEGCMRWLDLPEDWSALLELPAGLLP